jgi:hypothetical protein
MNFHESVLGPQATRCKLREIDPIAMEGNGLNPELVELASPSAEIKVLAVPTNEGATAG